MDGDARETTTPMLDVVVVVVTWNSAEVITGFIASLPRALDGLRHQLVVADNASTDGTLDVVRQTAPDATVVEVGRNGGYAAGINAAIRIASPSRTFLLCNPDVRLQPRAVRALLRAIRDPVVGIAVPRLIAADGTVHPSLRRRPTVLRTLGEAILGGDRAGRFELFGEVIRRPDVYERETDVDWATGAVMLVSGPCLETVGDWDESFFLYSEETDFALRARDHGFRVRYVPDAVAEHIEGEQERSPELWATSVRSRIRLFTKRHGPFHSALYRSAVILNECTRAVAGRATAKRGLRAALDPKILR